MRGLGKYRQTWALILTVILGVFASGCSLLVPSQQRLTITASEKDAQIYLDQKPIGSGTVTMKVYRNRVYHVLAEKPGFHPAEKTVRYKISATGWLDGIGFYFCLVPGIGMFAPGAQELEQSDVHLVLDPLGSRSTNAPSRGETKENSN